MNIQVPLHARQRRACASSGATCWLFVNGTALWKHLRNNMQIWVGSCVRSHGFWCWGQELASEARGAVRVDRDGHGSLRNTQNRSVARQRTIQPDSADLYLCVSHGAAPPCWWEVNISASNMEAPLRDRGTALKAHKNGQYIVTFECRQRPRCKEFAGCRRGQRPARESRASFGLRTVRPIALAGKI